MDKKILKTFLRPNGHGSLYEIDLVHCNGEYFLTDNGETYKKLDAIFEMKEPDVIKNLVAILKSSGARRIAKTNEFVIILGDWVEELLKEEPEESTQSKDESLSEKKEYLFQSLYRLLYCIYFMEKMTIFYT